MISQRGLLRKAAEPDLAPGGVLKDDLRSIALQKLAALPPAGKQGKQIPVPFRYETERPFAIAQPDLDRAKLGTVPLRTLIALEPVVKRKRVAQCIAREGPGAEHMRLPLWVVRHGGEDYLLDGHHRATARYLLGEREAQARVVTGHAK